MRHLLRSFAVLVLVVWASVAQAAISRVQSKSGSATSGTTIVVSGLSATSSSNVLIAMVSARGNASVPDFTTSGWTIVASGSTDVGSAHAYVAFMWRLGDGNTSYTLNSSVTLHAGGSEAVIAEYSGLNTTAPFDVASTAQTNTNSSVTTGAATATNSGSLALSCVLQIVGNTSFTSEAFPAALFNARSNTNTHLMGENINISGSQTDTATGASARWLAQVAIFKPPASAATLPWRALMGVGK